MAEFSKEIVVDLDLSLNRAGEFGEEAVKAGIRSFIGDPEILPSHLRGTVKVYSSSSKGDIVLLSSLNEIRLNRPTHKPFALRLKLESPNDIQDAVEASRLGSSVIIVETGSWKIIPLENLVAELHKHGTRILAKLNSPDEIETMFGILEVGVDGIVVSPKNVQEIGRAVEALSYLRRLDLKSAVVTEVRDVGLGDRACIDTASILSFGEGVLVGSKSNFFFLIHNESIGSSFTSPRPFRVNAGAVHSYMLMPDGRTKYLSELQSGERVLIVSLQGKGSVATIGRVKIERRPMRLVKAEYDGELGTVLVQNAETIRFLGVDGQLIAVTELKPQDRVLVHVRESQGRHFGQTVDEFILEK